MNNNTFYLKFDSILMLQNFILRDRLILFYVTMSKIYYIKRCYIYVQSPADRLNSFKKWCDFFME